MIHRSGLMHRNPPPPQMQQPKTAGANSKLDKTWGQGQAQAGLKTNLIDSAAFIGFPSVRHGKHFIQWLIKVRCGAKKPIRP
ncbi:hypothetical protein [Rhizobium laguerreae]|uniref:hypothetical protein n=1 Tax=Rhizobium laguerreae TaxID=1076926 RepID=UPI0013F14D22|nr:hypothetical protein [Rhizobium laguerreae]